MASDTCAQSRSVITKTRPFRWSHEMIELLINNIETYKTMCEYEGKDFDADRTKQYEWIRGNTVLRKDCKAFVILCTSG